MVATPNNLFKLPKWAQSHIYDLQMRLREAQDAIKRLEGAKEFIGIPPPGTVELWGYPIGPKDRVFVDTNRRVPRFWLEYGRYVEVQFRFRELEIRTGSGRLSISPNASNSVKIGISED